MRSAQAPTVSSSMFVDEARTATALRHPHIVSTFESGVERNFMYIAMELVRGPSLYRLNRRLRSADRTYPVEAILRIGQTVADALDYAQHVTVRGKALGLIHRDVSPHNILLDMSGRPFLSDFGVARSSFQEHETVRGEIRGKPGYMSPEQVNEEAMDHRSDLFALGIVLWEMTTLRRLFKRDTLMKSLLAVAYDPAPDIRRFRPDAPDTLAELVASLLEKSPANRPSTAAQVRDWCQRLLPSGRAGQDLLAALIGRSFSESEFDVDRWI
ncbi:MAG: serine/threonine protein kinase, partial [Myxococcales bacterium]|nr:serine/threonine protein kinase [Myxococcales bacterium]